MDTVCTRAARRWSGALATLIAATLLPCAPAAAVTDAEAIAMLNSQRALNGIPANVVVSPALSDSCAKHNAYIAANGGGLTHLEDPTRPGYTAEGAGLAGGANKGEVIHGGPDPWDAVRTNPWNNAPLHLWLMFQPAGGATGYDANGRSACMRFGLDGGAPVGVYSLPGNGVTGVPTVLDSSLESPYSPGDLVGVSDSQAGPPIVIWRVGSRVELAQATLASADEAVEVRLVDTRTPDLDGAPNRFGSFVVPVSRLRPATRYGLSVVFTDGLRYTTTFTTTGTAPAAQSTSGGSASRTGRRQSVGLRRSGGALVIRSAKPSGAVRIARVRFRSRGGHQLGRVRTVKLSGLHRLRIPRGARTVTITAKARAPYRALYVRKRLR